MKRQIICSRCGISKEFNKLIPKSCFDKNGNYFESHLWIKERICSCGHGETSHYFNKAGVLQCRIGDCFPFRTGGHKFKS